MGAQTFMRLSLEIQTMMQVLEDERDPAQQKEHRLTVARLVKELSKASGVRPAVMKRQALRDEMGGRG